MALFVISMML
uniref:Uncharacterized protein n=1 Tax=Arundo donax TaxID=35708 RepID=A0A0A8ZK59_ARUDO